MNSEPVATQQGVPAQLPMLPQLAAWEEDEELDDELLLEELEELEELLELELDEDEEEELLEELEETTDELDDSPPELPWVSEEPESDDPPSEEPNSEEPASEEPAAEEPGAAELPSPPPDPSFTQRRE